MANLSKGCVIGYTLYMRILLTVIFAAASMHAFAHTGGTSLEKTVDEYLIDIGTDASNNADAFSPITFDFKLFSAASTEAAPFSSVEFSIANSKSGIIASGELAAPAFGAPFVTVLLERNTDYTFSARYYRDHKKVVEADFPLRIKGASSFSFLPWLYVLGGAALGALAVMILRSRRA
jgi:hypothetical protein